MPLSGHTDTSIRTSTLSVWSSCGQLSKTRRRKDGQKFEVGSSMVCALKLTTIGNPPLLPRILNLQRSQLCYIVGTVYMEMPLKPNVLEDMAQKVCSIGHWRSTTADDYTALDRSPSASSQVLLCARCRAPGGRVRASASSWASDQTGARPGWRRTRHWSVALAS